MDIATERLLRNFPDNMTGALIDKLTGRNLKWCLRKLKEPTTGYVHDLKIRLKRYLGILGEEFADMQDAVVDGCDFPDDIVIEDGHDSFALKVTPSITRFLHLVNSGSEQVFLSSVDNAFTNARNKSLGQNYGWTPKAGDQIVSWAGALVCNFIVSKYLITIFPRDFCNSNLLLHTQVSVHETSTNCGFRL